MSNVSNLHKYIYIETQMVRQEDSEANEQKDSDLMLYEGDSETHLLKQT